ncbi:Dps family protein [Rickettsia prowazekii]|uniref:Ferritin/DPS domain-containing protein n=2 Tax=Rickettsia prowazekii TaxID=782 RepID=Q9ZCF0_RICPR|nr:Dps family protein [Rickettsia prowazekii]EOB10270.1 Penicillin-binding protein 1A [Rickettsia prowazekii str. GvF12]ADE30370.1 Strees induced DNA-binding Dps family protein [Rickettsia prowazekii str. Rp22]AFE49601.1 hypothetical protein M9W_03905 [Rickettsia prowazekii str. Chernikova]AFE50445.1 hypothetical protein M9Y_03910 [Rickettsia prowazekii str. Katsinyian]AFE51289.1 hypothetical protein MA1_03900 [Rickettsia prowazekii str. BuV67-CWPP]
MQLVKALEQILADSYVLYFKTQNYHWNVEGAEFRSLHLLFEEQYKDLAESLDEIAERIRSLGTKVPIFSNLIKLASIDGTNPSATANEMLKSLIKDQDIIRETLYNGLKVAQEERDECTADMIIGRIKVHEKNRWMLKSSLLI